MNLIFTFVLLAVLADAAFENWKPTTYKYCEHVTTTDTSTPYMGGVACGYNSYFYMTYTESVAIDSISTLGLINVGWLTTTALTTQKSFWKTCKSYLMLLYDGLYTDERQACVYSFNSIGGLPNCTNTNSTNLIFRGGSGYCMTKPVCGASVKVAFLASSDNSSSVYSWEVNRTSTYVAAGYRIVGYCYAYTKIYNPTMSNATITTTGEFF